MKNPINLKLSVSVLLLVLLTFCADDDPIQYQLETLCIPEETGTVTPLPGMYNEGTEIELKATPNEEYIFTNWTGDASGNVNPLTIIMLEDKNITAVFEKVNYSLAIEIIGEGTVNQEIILAKSTTDYESGTTVQITAVPDAEWEFVGWSGDHTSTENPIQLTIDKAMSLVATFEVESLEKTYVPDDNFENALIELGYDDVMDNYVYTYKIKNVDDLRIENKEIEDLTGIEGFENLIHLDLSNNNLQSLDVSHNIALQFLDCSQNQLTSLDVSSNTNLIMLNVEENPMSCVQVNTAQLPMFTAFYGSQGVIFSLNCDSGNEEKTYVPDDNFEQALIDLGLDDDLDNYVKTIDITYLTSLDISGRNISDLTGLEDFISLLTLDAHNNNISSADPFFGSSFGYAFASGTIILSDNKISSLDISALTCLTLLDVRNNPLTCIQVNEYHLSCIEGYSLTIMQVKTDEGVTTSLNCGN